MNEKTIALIMYLLMSIGAILVLIGVGLVFFTDIYITKGANGVLLIAALIAIGLLFLVPSKIYLTLMFMQRSDEKEKAV